jgi:hypothetical protein
MSRERIKEVARKILTGDVGIVEGSREICRARSGLPFAQLQAEVLLPFIAFDSELHEFPIGESRKYWNERALAEKDIQLQQLVENAERDMRRACIELLKAWD